MAKRIPVVAEEHGKKIIVGEAEVDSDGRITYYAHSDSFKNEALADDVTEYVLIGSSNKYHPVN